MLLALREGEILSENAARQISPLRLAYIGDVVWESLVRLQLLRERRNVHNMHMGAVKSVNAAAQSSALSIIDPFLTETERAVCHRGRNANARHHAPKHQSEANYHAATALEALFGYLYLTGQDERLLQLFHAAREKEEEPPIE